jgi:hypothetical protein
MMCLGNPLRAFFGPEVSKDNTSLAGKERKGIQPVLQSLLLTFQSFLLFILAFLLAKIKKRRKLEERSDHILEDTASFYDRLR